MNKPPNKGNQADLGKPSRPLQKTRKNTAGSPKPLLPALDLGSSLMKIRNELSSDVTAIEEVIVTAFQNAAHTDHTEQFIVRELRKAGALSVSLVVEDGGAVIGHVALSPVTISSGAAGWYGLGPIAVVPERQGSGIGAYLVRAGLDELRSRHASGCVVLGEPGYYSRFGFVAAPELVLPGVPPDYFQAISFNGSLPAGTVSYHDAFSAKT